MAGDKSSSQHSGNVRVVVRIRPLSKTEIQRGCKESITSMSQTLENFSDNNNNPSAGGAEVLQVQIPEKRWFEYDAVIGDQAGQEDVYIRSGAREIVVDDIFKGYNGTLLAYGQTGAGKTYTMGTVGDSDPGILPRAVDDLFATIQSKCDGNGKVSLQYLEIYNEEIRDLLVDGPAAGSRHQTLKIRETLDGDIYISGLTALPVKSPEEIGRVLGQAGTRRMVASTKMNAVSSRSHAICVFQVEGILNEGSEKFASKLTLVDLAGSERIKKTGAQGSRALEGIHINKSLMVLGQVVSSLSNTTSRRKPPYRDSKLTRLLQNSLGGNSRTIMLACVSPADYNVEESTNTLRYATSARNIKNSATQNIVKQISQEEALALQRENQLLKRQVKELQEALKKMSMPDDVTAPASSTQSTSEDEGEIGAEDDNDDNDQEGADVDEEESRDEVPDVVLASVNTNGNACVHANTPAISNTSASDETTSNTTTIPPTNTSTGSTPERNPSDSSLNSTNTGSSHRAIHGITKQMSEAQISQRRAVGRLVKQLSEAKLDLRRSAGNSAIEMPALRLQIAQLEGRLNQKQEVEKENDDLHQQLMDARADAAGARLAANKLTSIMDQLKSLKKDELHGKRVRLRHELKEQKWVDFVAKMLEKRSDQLEELHTDFDVVVKIVDNPEPEKSKRWGHRITGSGSDSNSNREQELKRSVQSFKDRMENIQSDIFVRVMSLQTMRDQIRNRCQAMEEEIGNTVGQTEEISAAQEQGVLTELFDMLMKPAQSGNAMEDSKSAAGSTGGRAAGTDGESANNTHGFAISAECSRSTRSVGSTKSTDSSHNPPRELARLVSLDEGDEDGGEDGKNRSWTDGSEIEIPDSESWGERSGDIVLPALMGDRRRSGNA